MAEVAPAARRLEKVERKEKAGRTEKPASAVGYLKRKEK